MTKQTKTLEGLKDSRILYEKKLPAFGYIIILLVLFLFIATLIWSIITPRTFVVRGGGIVESADRSNVMSPFSGEIYGMPLRNGDFVNEGDVLLVLRNTDLHLQAMQLAGNIEIIEQQIAQLERLEISIMSNSNLFDPLNADDRQFFNQFEEYQEQVAQNTVDVAMLERHGFTDAQIETELRNNEVRISEIFHATLRGVAESLGNARMEADGLRVQEETISEGMAEHAITANTSGILHMPEMFDVGVVVQAGSNLGSISAANYGVTINVFIDVNDMPRVSVGNSVDIAVAGLMESIYGTIPGTVVRIDSDITMPQGDGGQEGSAGFFMLTIEPEVDHLVSRNGVMYVLTSGMAIEARIIYDEITYFEYLLESIGVLTRG
jgi:multidrug efflux pump subunit AcrA (membrane-fusion protein)